MGNLFDRYFEISDRGSNIGTEIWAGAVTFMSMSYILVLNPQILADGGVDPEQAVLSTAVSSGVGCLMCGVFARLPVGLSPVAYLSVYAVYGLMKGQGFTLSESLSCCYVAGIFLGFFAVMKIATYILRGIPRCIKFATVGGMGLLLTLVGLIQSGIVVSDTETFVRLGDLHNSSVWMCMLGLVMLATLLFFQVWGSVLIVVLVLTITSWIMTNSWPARVFDIPDPVPAPDVYLDSFPQRIDAWLAVLAIMVVMVFDAAGTLNGLGTQAHLLTENGKIPGSMWMFISSAASTLLAARLGCPPVLIHIESAAGIYEGARTGVAACVTGVLFFLSMFFAPLFGAVPFVAVAPILILLGASMIGESKGIDWNNIKEALPAFACIVMVPFAYSVATGLFLGIGMSYILFLTTGEFVEYLPRCLCPWGREQSVTESTTLKTRDSEGFLGIEMHPIRSFRDNSQDQVYSGKPRTPSVTLFDDRDMMRRPNLLVGKGIVESMDEAQLIQEMNIDDDGF
mmetsp:Transcript_6593/g.8918  ORF Transcript_6593/g.8918 Transcript_6593/m.8918 type:complete len:511 (-) Transcript_6593:195-1727(-)